MKLSQESIFSASLRSFFTSAFAVLGFVLASIPFFLISSAFVDDQQGEPISHYQAHVQSNADGRRQVLDANSPYILEINIQGPIGTKKLNAETIRQQLQEAKEGNFKDGRVKAILLNISSPGGTVHDSDSIYRALMDFKTRQEIPIYAYVDGLCASGGMYIASAADKIYAHSVSLVGSIGVIMQFMNASNAMENLGLSAKTLIAGKEKDAMNPLRPWAPDEEVHYQALTNFFYQRFVHIVTKSRPQLSQEALVEDYGAKIFNAARAKEIGLIDHAEAEREDVIRDLAQEANIESYQVIELRHKNAWMPPWLDARLFFAKKEITHRLELPSELQLENFLENTFFKEKFLYLYRP